MRTTPAAASRSAAAVEAAVERLARHDRTVTWAGLGVVLALTWAYTVLMAATPMPGDAQAVPGIESLRPWTALDVWLVLVMWIVMMVAMMTPSAVPMLAAFARLGRLRGPERPAAPATFAFLLGYLAVWSAFSVVATLAQWSLHSAALLSPQMTSASALLSGALLVAAGVYQLTPLKHACLAKCRTPMGFLVTEWRDGLAGKFVMGARHGAWCVGCCGLLMGLLFVGGVMSLLWIAGLAAVALAEKILPHERLLSVAIGVVGTTWGLWLLASA